jgi:S-adenosylmethionine:tRNA ribosyltransferase-isomerase
MRADDFDFELPADRIALRPARPRDSARLLEVDAAGALVDHQVVDLPGLLRPGDALVFNDTQVIAARLVGRRERNGVVAAIFVTLHKRCAPDRWRAFARPAKRLAVGDQIRFAGDATS